MDEEIKNEETVEVQEVEIETPHEEILTSPEEETANENVPVEENQPEEEKATEKILVDEPTNIEAIVEGLLYVVGEDGVRLEQLSKVINKSLEDTEVILQNIMHKYAQEIYGIELVGYGKVYKFISKKTVFPYAQELFQTVKANTLSQSALETLSIIAYKQPITRVEIEELRGVGADMMLRKLLARNLIREAGRSEAPGRPILYEVTEEFMDSFKLTTLNELPDLPEFTSDDETNLFD